jgi:hypothetical protein
MDIKLFTDAVKNLLPDNTPFNINGATYAGIEILNDTALPSEDAVMAEYASVEAAEPMRRLRRERDRLLVESDWSQGNDVPVGIQSSYVTYRQQLRDLPSVSTPVLDGTDRTGITSVTWPTKPS